MRSKPAAAALMFFGLGYAALSMAQAADPTTDQRIRDLEARVSALERRQGIQPGAPAAATATPVASPVAAQPAMQPEPAAPPPPRVVAAPTASAWSELHRGMTVSQVTALLGKPGDTRVLPQSSTYYYPDIHGSSVEFDRNGRVDQWSQP